MNWSTIPGHIVDIDFHDAEVRDGGAEMRAHQAGEMAVEIMRRAVGLMRLAHCGDLERGEDAVPGHVDDGDVHRIIVEEGLEAAQAKKRFAGCDRGLYAVADMAQGVRVIEIDLEPE